AQHWTAFPGYDSAYTSTLIPPFVHEAAVEMQEGLAGSSHWVNQTRSGSVSGAAAEAVLRLLSVIVTRKQAVPAGWQLDANGQATVDATMSRFGIEALEPPSAS